MMEIPYSSDSNAPGPWWKHLTTPTGPSASMRCTNGHDGILTDHTIAEDGKVDPSVVCDAKGCGFHEQVRLIGWPRLAKAIA